MAASLFHSAIQSNVAHALMDVTEFRIHTELTIEIDGTDYKPDLVGYPFKELDYVHDMVKERELPLFAIEIVSPRQTTGDVIDKIDLYLQAGIPSCWLIIPFPKSVVVFHKEGKLTFHEGTIHDEVTQIQLPLKDIFR